MPIKGWIRCSTYSTAHSSLYYVWLKIDYNKHDQCRIAKHNIASLKCTHIFLRPCCGYPPVVFAERNTAGHCPDP